MPDEALGPWSEDLEQLFGQTEDQYWEEQYDNYVKLSVDLFGENPIGSSGIRGGSSFDKGGEEYFGKTSGAKLEAFNRALDALLTEAQGRQAAEDKALDDAVEKAMAEEEEKKRKRELDAVEGDDDDDPDTPTEDEHEGDDDDDPSTPHAEQPVGMPTDGDDYVGVVVRFWGGDGPRDPMDAKDVPIGGRFSGGEAPIDPWDRYDGVAGRPSLYGGDEPTPAWERVGPKFRPL